MLKFMSRKITLRAEALFANSTTEQLLHAVPALVHLVAGNFVKVPPTNTTFIDLFLASVFLHCRQCWEALATLRTNVRLLRTMCQSVLKILVVRFKTLCANAAFKRLCVVLLEVLEYMQLVLESTKTNSTGVHSF